MTKPKMLLTAVALSAGMTMMLDGCTPRATTTPVKNAPITVAPAPKPVKATEPAKEASMPAAPVAKPVGIAKPKLTQPCVRKVQRVVGNGKGASHTKTSWAVRPASDGVCPQGASGAS